MKTLVQKWIFFPLVYNKGLCCTWPTKYSSHGSLHMGMDSSHESLFNSCCTLPTRLFQWHFLFFLLKESKGKKRKEKVHSSKVAHNCTIGHKVAFRKKTLKSFNTNVKWTTIFGLLQKIFHFTHIWGMSWVQKKKRENPLGWGRKFFSI